MSGGGGGSSSPPPPSGAEREASRIAIEKWNDYLDRYAPAEQQLANRIYDMGRNTRPFEDQLAADVSAQSIGAVKDAYKTAVNFNNLAHRSATTDAVRQAALASGLGQSATPLAANKRAWDAGYAYAQAGSSISGEGLGRLSKLGSIQNDTNIVESKARADAANSELTTLGELAYGLGSFAYNHRRNSDLKKMAEQARTGWRYP